MELKSQKVLCQHESVSLEEQQASIIFHDKYMITNGPRPPKGSTEQDGWQHRAFNRKRAISARQKKPLIYTRWMEARGTIDPNHKQSTVERNEQEMNRKQT